MCGPRQLFLLHCSSETPQGWTPLVNNTKQTCRTGTSTVSVLTQTQTQTRSTPSPSEVPKVASCTAGEFLDLPTPSTVLDHGVPRIIQAFPSFWVHFPGVLLLPPPFHCTPPFPRDSCRSPCSWNVIFPASCRPDHCLPGASPDGVTIT